MFKWKDDFSVNLKSIAEQHQELFKIGSNLYTIVSAKDGIDRYDEIMEVLAHLKNYALYHFSYEEELMKKYGYDKYEVQKREHELFVKKVQSISEEEVDEKQRKVGMEIIMFIANWIENHILRSDMGYSEYLNNKGVK